MIKNKLDLAVKNYMETKDQKYFTEIYNSLNKRLLNFIRKTVYDKDTAQEILSNTFERLVVSLNEGKYKPIGTITFSTYAHTCATNAVRYYLRYYNKTYQSDEISKKDEGYSVKDYSIDEVHKARTDCYTNVMNFINNDLTHKNDLQRVAQLFYLEREIIEDIAIECNMNISNVKYRLRKIRQEIRKNVVYYKNVIHE